jgi:hypothetical protein
MLAMLAASHVGRGARSVEFQEFDASARLHPWALASTGTSFALFLS